MSLKYALLENLLTEKLNEYTAQPQNVVSHKIEHITEKIIQRGSIITKSDAIAVINSFFEVIQEITQKGEAINTDLLNTNFSIQGVFEGADDIFDSKRHALKVNISAGKLLKKTISSVSIEKITATEVLPRILEVKDSISGSINKNITSEGVVEIIGSMLKIVGENPRNGIAFIDSNGTANKVVTIAENRPGKVFIIAPNLAPGVYTIEVTTQYGYGENVKNPRTGVFYKPLTVV